MAVNDALSGRTKAVFRSVKRARPMRVRSRSVSRAAPSIHEREPKTAGQHHDRVAAKPVTVLIIDHEPSVHSSLGGALSAAGYAPLRADTGAEGLAMIQSHQPDAVLLDLALPDMDGKVILQEGRSIVHGPILVVSGRTRESEKVDALNLGADDYVEKPFGIGELLARLRTGLRVWSSQRPATAPARPALQGAVEIDRERTLARVHGKPVRLSPKEYRLIAHLAAKGGLAATYDELLQAVWDEGEVKTISNLRTLVALVRRKTTVEPGAPPLIINEQGVGYKLLL